MGAATVIHRFITDVNPINVEWIVVRTDAQQDKPDGSIDSHLINPLCGVVLPANQDRAGAPSKASLKLQPGSQELQLCDVEKGQDLLLLLIGFGSVDYRDKFRAEGTGGTSRSGPRWVT